MRFQPKPWAAAGLLSLCAVAHAGEKVWISLGDAALAQLQKQRAVTPAASVAPMARLAGVDDLAHTTTSTPAGRQAERIHLVQVDEDDLLQLSAAVHRELRRCGGFMFHPTQAEGLASLQRQAGTARLAAVAAPAMPPPITMQVLGAGGVSWAVVRAPGRCRQGGSKRAYSSGAPSGTCVGSPTSGSN